MALALGLLIGLGCAVSLWWLLREESLPVLLALAALCGGSLALRLVFTTQFPPGFNEDETKMLWCAAKDHQAGRLFGESCIEIPVLLAALFEAPLISLLGPGRWAIRTYSLVTSVLATPAAFAAARALGLRILPSLAVGALLAVAPWSIFYGRIAEGGEIVFHQLLLLAALARLMRAAGGWPEVAIGSLGLCMLLYDYWCGRAMLAMTVVAALLARGKHRLLCLAILLFALFGWVPYWSTGPPNALVGFADRFDPTFAQQPLAMLWSKTQLVLTAFLYPVAADGWLTIRAAAMHPPLLLGLALFGGLSGGRRALFLWAGFLGGLAPAVLGEGDFVSTHRLMMAYPFIVLAAGSALERVRSPAWRVAITGIVVVVIGVQSVRLFFSDTFWPEGSRAQFPWDVSALVEAIPPPPHPPMFLERKLSFFKEPWQFADPSLETLTVESWLPPDGTASIYAFSRVYGPLRSFYGRLVGQEKVTAFGDCFLVTLAARDWSWLRAGGWSYETRCADRLWIGQVPTLFQYQLSFRNIDCPEGPVRHRWRGRWLGPKTLLRLRSNGVAVVETSLGQTLIKMQSDPTADFFVGPNTDVSVEVTVPTGAQEFANLVEVTAASERVPDWEMVRPEFANSMSRVGFDTSGQTAPILMSRAAPRRVRLTELQPTKVEYGFAPPVTNGRWGDGGPLELGGAVYEDGFGVHAWTRLTYAVPLGAARFEAIAGIADEARRCGEPSVTFEVRDEQDQLLYDSGPMDKTTPPSAVSVELGGAQAITLVVTEGGDGLDCDHAIWARPAFVPAVGQ